MSPSPPEDWDAIRSGLGFESGIANALLAAGLILIPAFAICAMLGLL